MYYRIYTLYIIIYIYTYSISFIRSISLGSNRITTARSSSSLLSARRILPGQQRSSESSFPEKSAILGKGVQYFMSTNQTKTPSEAEKMPFHLQNCSIFMSAISNPKLERHEKVETLRAVLLLVSIAFQSGSPTLHSVSPITDSTEEKDGGEKRIET